MDTLAEDLLLLLIQPESGLIANARRIDFGLAGAELVRMAAHGRIDIVQGYIVLRDPSPTGDPLLDISLD
ncbi:MAG TPA: GPP34 family phosphoprotein, partial [Streptosporangiaceae bacterium]